MPLRPHHNKDIVQQVELMRPDVNPFAGEFVSMLTDRSTPVFDSKSACENKGSWHQSAVKRFDKLVVEIGSHYGRVLSDFAKDHPETLVVGMEITFKRVVKSTKKAQSLGLQNVRCMLANAREFKNFFSPEEIDGVIIFFPDPWPKIRHEKNRLLNESFCQELYSCLAPDAFVWFKTDFKPYFEVASLALHNAGFRMSNDQKPETWNYTSIFEDRFQQQGLERYEGFWKK